MAQMIKEWVMSFEQYIKEPRIDQRFSLPSLQNPKEFITAPEVAMQIDLVPEFHPSGGFNEIVTAMAVFSHYLFAYPTSNSDAKTTAKFIISKMIKHAYWPTIPISDKESAFVSHVIKEVASIFEITLKHAITKHAQTIGMLERSYASIKQALKIETSERRSLWHKDVNIAVLNYNRPYHAINGCEPSRLFHGRILHNFLDLKMGICPQKSPTQIWQFAQDVLEQMELNFQDVRKIAKLTLNTKRIRTRKLTLQNSKKQIMCMSYSLKQIIKELKFPLQNFGGLGLNLLKRPYQTTISWYEKLTQTKRKCFIARDYANSYPDHLYPMYKSRHENGDPTWKWSLNMLVHTPEHGSVNTKGQFLIAIMIMRHSSTQRKSHYDLIYEPTKWVPFQEPYKEVPQKLFPR